MDNDLQILEAELSRLRPAATRPALETRLRQELGSAEPPGRAPASSRVWWLAAAALPIAAGVFGVLAIRNETPAVPTAPVVATRHSDMLKPVSAENVLYAATEEGIVTLADGTPARRERLQFVDTIVWRNPRTHASLTWTVPREEVRVVPINYQ